MPSRRGCLQSLHVRGLHVLRASGYPGRYSSEVLERARFGRHRRSFRARCMRKSSFFYARKMRAFALPSQAFKILMQIMAGPLTLWAHTCLVDAIPMRVFAIPARAWTVCVRQVDIPVGYSDLSAVLTSFVRVPGRMEGTRSSPLCSCLLYTSPSPRDTR